MDSLAQELVDEIINHIPREDMPASSLVARRWKRRSQQRNFEFVLFEFKDLTPWEINIPQDPKGIPSYVHHVRFENFPSYVEPGHLSRVLKNFTSMISLTIDTHLPPPAELAVPVSLGEFGKGITCLTLFYVQDSFAAITSLIFSLPELKELIISNVDFQPDQPPRIVPDTPQRAPLDLFMVHGVEHESYIFLARWNLASRGLSLDLSDEGMRLLVKISSEAMVALTLTDGFWSSRGTSLPIIHLPSFPSLARVRVELATGSLSDPLAGFLSSIHLAPELSSVTFSFVGRWVTTPEFPSSGNWIVVDEWLARMVAARAVKKACLKVVLTGWQEDNSNWEGYFPEFRRAGGELRR